MNKKLLAIGLSVVTALSLTGCKKDAPIEDSSSLINTDESNLNYAEKSELGGVSTPSDDTSSTTSSETSDTTSKPQDTPKPTTRPNTTKPRPTGGVAYNTTIKEKTENEYPKFGEFEVRIADEESAKTLPDGEIVKEYWLIGRTFEPGSYGVYKTGIAGNIGADPVEENFSISIEENDKNKYAFEFNGIGHKLTSEDDTDTSAATSEFYIELEQDGEIVQFDMDEIDSINYATMDFYDVKALAVKADKEIFDKFTKLGYTTREFDKTLTFYCQYGEKEDEKIRVMLGYPYELIVDKLGEGEELVEELLDKEGNIVETNYYYAYKNKDYTMIFQKSTVLDTDNAEPGEEGIPRDIITAIILIRNDVNANR